jgi:MFS family permease
MAGIPAGRIVDRFGAYTVSIAGLGAIATGSLLMSMTGIGSGVYGYITRIVIITAGHALFQAANNTRVMMNVPSDRKGAVSGLLSLSRNLGLITGTSVMGAVFALASATIDTARANPEGVASGLNTTFAVASGLILAALAIAVGPRRLARFQRLIPVCAFALLSSSLI